MEDRSKTKKQLLAELAEVRQRVAELEALESERQRAEEALRSRDRDLTLLSRAGQDLATTLDLQQITEQLLPAATEIIGAEGASVWLRDQSPENWLVCRTAYHHSSKHSLVNLRLRPGQGVAGWVVDAGESIIVPDVKKETRFFSGIDEQTGFSTASLLAAPLWARDRVIGVLEVVNKLEGEFDEHDLLLAEVLAASSASVIENARLAEAVHQRTVDLQACYKRLSDFYRALSDDLRGPLGLIVSFAQVLQADYATLSEEELHHYVGTISQRGRDMVQVIDDLLVARDEPIKEAEEEVNTLDMAAVVNDALERLYYIIEEKRAEIVLPTTWPVALGHGPWVEEVWVNYLSNAVKYGGEPPHVEVGAIEQVDGMARFWVHDNGPGIAPEEQERLFAPVTRRDRARDPEYEMGLALARRIIEKLGGEVGVESRVGEGSLFFFTLPLAK
jgi:signal transduction histidine kinase